MQGVVLGGGALALHFLQGVVLGGGRLVLNVQIRGLLGCHLVTLGWGWGFFVILALGNMMFLKSSFILLKSVYIRFHLLDSVSKVVIFLFKLVVFFLFKFDGSVNCRNIFLRSFKLICKIFETFLQNRCFLVSVVERF